MRTTRLLLVILAVSLIAAACGDDDAAADPFSVEQAWCIGFVDAIELSASMSGVEATEQELEGALVTCMDEAWHGIAEEASVFLRLVESDDQAAGYCRGRIAGDITVAFQPDAQLQTLEACFGRNPYQDSGGFERATRIYGG